MPRGCVNRIQIWPLRRNDHSDVLIGASGTRRSDWSRAMLHLGDGKALLLSVILLGCPIYDETKECIVAAQ